MSESDLRSFCVDTRLLNLTAVNLMLMLSTQGRDEVSVERSSKVTQQYLEAIAFLAEGTKEGREKFVDFVADKVDRFELKRDDIPLQFGSVMVEALKSVIYMKHPEIGENRTNQCEGLLNKMMMEVIGAMGMFVGMTQNDFERVSKRAGFYTAIRL